MKMRLEFRRSVCAFLVLSLTLSPSIGLAQQPNSAAKARAAAIKLIPEDANLVVIALPSATMKAPGLDMMPVEVLSALGRERLGLDPADIEIAVLAANITPQGFPVAAVALRLSQDLDPDNIPMELTGERRIDELNGKPYWKTTSGLNFYFANSKTVFVGFDNMIRSMIEKNKAESPLKKHLAAGKAANIQAIMMLEAMQPMIRAELSQMPELPGDLNALKTIPQETEAIEIRIVANDFLEGSVALHAEDEATAQRISGTIEAALQTGQEMILRDMATGGSDQVSLAMNRYTKRMAKRAMDMIRPQVRGTKLVLGGKTNSETQVVAMGTLAALLLPAVSSARTAARRVDSMNSLKMIALGMLNYESAYQRFPAQAISDEDGKPLLSWRVAVLPFIDEAALYEQFHLDEPWDSEHNKELIPLMPDVFRSSGQPDNGKTHFLGLVGENAFFSGDHGKKGRRIAEFEDGTSKTLITLEADKSVVWTKPEDIDFDPDKPLANLGQLRKPIFNAAFCDGHIEAISNQVQEAVMKAMVTINGGERVR